MQGTFIGFNTAGITFEERFLALLLKVKKENGFCEIYYLQAPVLADLLLILQSRMAVVFQRLENQGEAYKDELITYNEALVAHIPQVETAEIQQPSPERRIMSITLKPGETQSTLILVFQDEQISTLCIDDLQIEALIIGIQQALKTVGDQELVQYLSSNMDFNVLYRRLNHSAQYRLPAVSPGRLEAKPVFPLSGRAVLLRDRRRQENCLRSGGQNQRAAFIRTGK